MRTDVCMILLLLKEYLLLTRLISPEPFRLGVGHVFQHTRELTEHCMFSAKVRVRGGGGLAIVCSVTSSVIAEVLLNIECSVTWSVLEEVSLNTECSVT